MTSGGELPKEISVSHDAKALIDPPAASPIPPTPPPKDTEHTFPTSNSRPVEDPALSSEQPVAPAHKSSSSSWSTPSPEHPLAKLNQRLPDLIAQATYSEVYGLDIDPSAEADNSFHRNMILQKFLRANANDVEKAADQLLATLKWRKEFKPLEARDAVFSRSNFGGLGYVTRVKSVEGSPNDSDVVTFNIYGAVKDKQSTFGDTEAFMRWRVALMELSLQHLNLAAAQEPIPDYNAGPDPYQGIQVHDYLNVSFLRQDPHVKAASAEAIDTFKKYYPETLSRKFMVNVPRLMTWMFSAMSLVMPAETAKKIQMLADGKELGRELGMGVPEEYGGKGGRLVEIGETTRLG